jgi:hypothetical protein
MKRVLTIVSIAILTLAVSSIVLAQNSPFVGAWKLNVAKSKFDPGPPRKSETRTYTKDGYHVTIQRVNGDGSSQSYSYGAKDDGNDYPITGQGPQGTNMIAMKSVSANKIEATNKTNGKVLFKTTYELSKDGKSLTVISKGNDKKGQPFNNVTIYDKQ